MEQSWRDGFLDEPRLPRTCRIRVRVWQNLERLEGLYFIPPRRWRLLWNYLREVGLAGVVRKLRSRWAERIRNEKFISCGLGEIVATDEDSEVRPGEVVVFLAPSHPRCAERVVVPVELLTVAGVSLPPDDGYIEYLPPDPAESDRWWADLAAWSPFSGSALDRDTWAKALERARALFAGDADRAGCRRLPARPASPIQEATEPTPRSSRQPFSKRAVLFGYGNYAKTVILPSVSKQFGIECIHEMDPTQIPPRDRKKRIRYDTSPWPRPEESYSVYLIAGYHHTHAPLAVHALRSGAYAIVEKPVVTDRAQLEKLLAALRASGPRLFACFHKRYSSYNALAREDLGLAAAEPVSYHAVVYEVPLPPRHWYRWPNSRSRIVSNACHWIDHFLFLNGYSVPVHLDVWVAQDGTTNLSAELANGAVFTLALTDRGSGRIGLREYVEFRTDRSTVRIVDGRHYSAENGERILRRRSVSKLRPYIDMYQRIAAAVSRDEPGDSIESLRVSAGLVLDFEESFEHAHRLRNPPVLS